jgi:SAM-dependent methyltransferase
VNRIDKARSKIEERVYRDAVGEPRDPVWKTLWAFLSEAGFAARVVRKRLNMPTPLNTTDRMVLEQQILPHYRLNRAIRNILFVGCDTYTAHYQRTLFIDVNYVTIEPDPALARFGATPHHVVAPLEQLARHFPPASFDLIICNGVFGWGLDGLEQCNAAFDQCHTCLRQDGHLLLGWDDVPRRRPIELEQIPSLARFRKYVFPEFGSWRYLTATPFRHTFDFYQK